MHKSEPPLLRDMRYDQTSKGNPREKAYQDDAERIGGASYDPHKKPVPRDLINHGPKAGEEKGNDGKAVAWFRRPCHTPILPDGVFCPGNFFPQIKRDDSDADINQGCDPESAAYSERTDQEKADQKSAKDDPKGV